MKNFHLEETSILKSKLLKFINCQVLESTFTEQSDLLYDGEVIVDKEKGVIVDIIRKDKKIQLIEGSGTCDSRKFEIIDCEGNLLAPGFIDVQCEFKNKTLIKNEICSRLISW